MRYSGGKIRQAKRLVNIFEDYRDTGQPYLEPFCGSFAVGALMGGERYASDVDGDIVGLLRAIGTGWVPPEFVTEEEYERCRQHPELFRPEMRGFLGYGCSFSGIKWSRYAKDENKRNYALNCKNSLLRIAANLEGVNFLVRPYSQWSPEGMLIYCDPPYINTTLGVVGGTYQFNPFDFWDLMRKWSQSNKVFVTERMAPFRGTKLLDQWSRVKPTNTRQKSTKAPIIENLYQVIG